MNTKIKTALILASIIFLIPGLHLAALLGPYISFFAVAYLIRRDRRTKKTQLKNLIRAVSVGLLIIMFFIISARYLVWENAWLRYHHPRSEPSGMEISLDMGRELAEGEEFELVLSISGITKPINTAEVGLSYPAKMLEIEEIDSSQSAFNIFVEKNIEQDTGHLQFLAGRKLSETIGKQAQLVVLRGRALQAGTAEFSFEPLPRIYLDDGRGINSLTSVPETMSFEILQKSTAAAPVTEATDEAATTDKLALHPDTQINAPEIIQKNPIDWVPDSWIEKLIAYNELVIRHYSFFIH